MVIALLSLPEEHRNVLTDKYVDNLTVKDIARRCGKSPKAVEMLLGRAREQLRSLLRHYFLNPTGSSGNEHDV